MPRLNARSIAICAELFYLINLLALPGVMMLGLYFIYSRHRHQSSHAARHARFAWHRAWLAMALLGLPALLFWQLAYYTPVSWTIFLLYMIITHTTLVLWGIFNLARAMNID